MRMLSTKAYSLSLLSGAEVRRHHGRRAGPADRRQTHHREAEREGRHPQKHCPLRESQRQGRQDKYDGRPTLPLGCHR